MGIMSTKYRKEVFSARYELVSASPKPIQVPLFLITGLSPHLIASARSELTLKEISNQGLCGKRRLKDKWQGIRYKIW